MEIVKQRKRRLLAWILTIALCVGVWQGSAYATEGSVSGNGVESGEMNQIISETENPVQIIAEEEEPEIAEGTENPEETCIKPFYAPV